MPEDASSLTASTGVLSPKLGALLHLTPGLGWYVNASRGFRSTDGIIDDPTLAPIVVWNYESGLKYDRSVHGELLSATASLFRINFTNEQTFNPLNGASNNGAASRRQGLELDAHASLGSAATLSTDWTFLDARYRHLTAVAEDDPTGPPAVLDGLRVYNTARYLGSAALDIAPQNSWWRLRLSGNWVGPYSPFDEPGVVLGAYGLAHVSGMVQWGGAQLQLGVRNLFNRAYPELVAGHVYDPGQPRALFTTLRTTF